MFIQTLNGYTQLQWISKYLLLSFFCEFKYNFSMINCRVYPSTAWLNNRHLINLFCVKRLFLLHISQNRLYTAQWVTKWEVWDRDFPLSSTEIRPSLNWSKYFWIALSIFQICSSWPSVAKFVKFSRLFWV